MKASTIYIKDDAHEISGKSVLGVVVEKTKRYAEENDLDFSIEGQYNVNEQRFELVSLFYNKGEKCLM